MADEKVHIMQFDNTPNMSTYARPPTLLENQTAHPL